MLSRPQAAQVSPADRAQLAALFGMMGLVVGVVVVAALAWLYTLGQQLHDQTLALAKLEKSVDQTDRVQMLALDTLLAKTEEGRDPRKFVENYQKVQRDLESSRDSVKEKERLTALAMADNRRLEKELEAASKDKVEALQKAQDERADYEAERDKARELKSTIEAIYKTPQGELAWKYSTSLYAAIAGWIVALLSLLGLLAMSLTKDPLDPGPEARPGSITIPVPGVSPEVSPPEEPPHQIS